MGGGGALYPEWTMKSSIVYIRGFQPGVRVPLGVGKGLSGGTRAPFYLLKKKSFITLLPVTVL